MTNRANAADYIDSLIRTGHDVREAAITGSHAAQINHDRAIKAEAENRKLLEFVKAFAEQDYHDIGEAHVWAAALIAKVES